LELSKLSENKQVINVRFLSFKFLKSYFILKRIKI
jgi:hypothetical protein